MSKVGQEKIYEMVTENITQLLENGLVPWHQSWIDGSIPCNRKSKFDYRGINVFVLTSTAMLKGYASKWWCSYKQAMQLGGQVKKGETGTTVIFWKLLEKQDKDDSSKKVTIPLLRYYKVFNLDQIDNLSESEEENANNCFYEQSAGTAQQIIDGMPTPPTIKNGVKPCYIPDFDEVQIPPFRKFDQAEEYYGTMFHELTHSTGHESRLKRPGITNSNDFGSESYSKEELIAEMGSAFLCGTANISMPVIQNQASYIQGWLKALHGDKKLVIHAAGAAQKATDYILNT